jgi:hypothetical protein
MNKKELSREWNIFLGKLIKLKCVGISKDKIINVILYFLETENSL